MIIYKNISRFPDYEISNDGIVRRVTSGRGAVAGKTLKWRTHTSSGYPDVRFSVNGKQTAIPVHCLVARAFLGEKPEGMQVRHLDGNKMNSHSSNLCYGSAKENAQDKVRHGRSSKGIANPKNKLSVDQVHSIRLQKTFASAQFLAEFYRINPSTVYRIWSRTYWSHV